MIKRSWDEKDNILIYFSLTRFITYIIELALEPSEALYMVLIVTPAVYPHLDDLKSQNQTKNIPVVLPRIPNQNLRQIGPGVLEL